MVDSHADRRILLFGDRTVYSGNQPMFGRNQISDKELLKTVNQRLARTGTGGQSKISASVLQGTITLSGSLQYAMQRSPIVKAASNIAGVRRVIDQMQIVAKAAC
jgi:osmotically-inducible protein OsmY